MLNHSITKSTLLALGMLLSAAGGAHADDSNVCMWRGAAPFCAGLCPQGWTTEKRDKQGPADSKKCVTGDKVYCCFEQVEEVFGKAPACAGKCPVGWTYQGDSEVGEKGQKCLTGKAVICSKDMP
jgi:hypothetical protein